MLELYRPRISLIHQTHARVKIIFTLVFILAVNLSSPNAWPAYILFFSIAIALIILSRLGVDFVFRRSLLAFPFFLSAIPLIFWGPEPRIVLDVSGFFSLSVSPEGIERCASILIKSWLSILTAIILTGTTTFQDLISGFRKFHVPLVLVSIIEMMWRYLFIMVDEVTRLLRARNSRSSISQNGHNTGGSILWRASVTGNMAGSLFLRSIERSERVYAAMLSRGYNGELLEDKTNGYSKTDEIRLVFSVVIVLLVYISGVLSGR